MNKSRFSLEIESDIDKKALNAFVKGASKHEVNSKEWCNEDPDALPTYNFRLRLNKYQIGLLKRASKIEKRSMSNMVKSILLTELEKYINKER